MNTRVYVRGLAVAALLCGLLAGVTPTRAAPTFPETVTYQGTIEAASGTAWSSYGGTILLTFESGNELVRVEVGDFVYGVITLPDYHEKLRPTINRLNYYNAAPPKSDGTFAAVLSLDVVGSGVYVGLVVEGTVDSQGQVSGTITLACTPIACGLNAPFTAYDRVDMPPADTDTVVMAEVEHGGTILFALNGDERLTALALREVAFPHCAPDHPFNVISFHDAPETFDVGLRVDANFLSVSGRKSAEGIWTGTVHFRDSVYDDCNEDVRWSTTGFPTAQPSQEPTMVPTPQPTSVAPKLPASGTGAARDSTFLLDALLAGFGALLVSGGACSLRRR